MCRRMAMVGEFFKDLYCSGPIKIVGERENNYCVRGKALDSSYI